MSKLTNRVNTSKKVVDINSNIKLMSFLWNLGSIFQFITIPLHLAAMKNRAITYEWFVKLREFEYIEVVYCAFAAITMFVFSILVVMNRNRGRWKDMWIGLLCFATQIGMLIWFITP